MNMPACSGAWPMMLGRSHVLCSKVMPSRVMSLTGSSGVPSVISSVSRAGATTSAVRMSSPGKGM